jgi:hypothetical protein
VCSWEASLEVLKEDESHKRVQVSRWGGSEWHEWTSGWVVVQNGSRRAGATKMGYEQGAKSCTVLMAIRAEHGFRPTCGVWGTGGAGPPGPVSQVGYGTDTGKSVSAGIRTRTDMSTDQDQTYPCI